MVCVSLWKHNGINWSVAETQPSASMSVTGSLWYNIPMKISQSLRRRRMRNNLSIRTHEFQPPKFLSPAHQIKWYWILSASPTRQQRIHTIPLTAKRPLCSLGFRVFPMLRYIIFLFVNSCFKSECLICWILSLWGSVNWAPSTNRHFLSRTLRTGWLWQHHSSVRSAADEWIQQLLSGTDRHKGHPSLISWSNQAKNFPVIITNWPGCISGTQWRIFNLLFTFIFFSFSSFNTKTIFVPTSHLPSGSSKDLPPSSSHLGHLSVQIPWTQLLGVFL